MYSHVSLVTIQTAFVPQVTSRVVAWSKVKYGGAANLNNTAPSIGTLQRLAGEYYNDWIIRVTVPLEFYKDPHLNIPSA